MKSYNLLERNLAKALEKFPQLKQTAKSTYQLLNYWYYGDRNFKLSLAPQVTITTPQSWSDVDSNGTEALFFGYYDKTPWSPDMSKLAYHWRNGDRLKIVVYDQQQKSQTVLAETKAWSSQQGSMLQWLPDGNYLLFNDNVAGCLVTRIIDLANKQEKILPLPVQTLHPDGEQALSLNYKRLDLIRPEYGYSTPATNLTSDLSYADDGIWHLDFKSEATKLLISLQDLIDNEPRPEMENCQHKVNHIMYSPQGSRYVFMHRWLGSQGKYSRLYVADSQTNSLKLLLDERMVSHYSWRDETHLLAWARTAKDGDRYYLIDVISGEKEVIGQGVLDVYGDGHPSFSPDGKWILTDTYPDKARQQHLLLFEVATGKVSEIASFLAPLKYSAQDRCDLHPRWSPDSKWVSVDSTYEGKHMSYLLDISHLVTN